MSNKSKQIILVIIGLTALSVILLSNLNRFSEDENEAADFRNAEDIEEVEADVDLEEVEADMNVEEIEAVEDAEETEAVEDAAGEQGKEDIEFSTTDEPYRAYIEAREKGKPIVLEFYARW